MIFDTFIDRYLGKSVDVDGMYGSQCVDLFNAWNRDFNNCYINCQPSGFAKSLAQNKENNGILKYFTETAVNNMIKGTVVVYGNCKQCPDSHVCFFIADNGDGTFMALQQNAYGRKYVTIDNMSYVGIIGSFIPNQLLNKSDSEYINIPPSIEVRNVYYLDKNEVKAQIKPKKFGGLSYKVHEKTPTYATIKTNDFGLVRVKITPRTPIKKDPLYEKGNRE